mmetsp:Transcript_767/g.1222  ORF Transcript_767/g.1222 Transcript_767/m.1222 type:complete len:228 (+) Transcript_767:168-851(+)
MFPYFPIVDEINTRSHTLPFCLLSISSTAMLFLVAMKLHSMLIPPFLMFTTTAYNHIFLFSATPMFVDSTELRIITFSFRGSSFITTEAHHVTLLEKLRFESNAPDSGRKTGLQYSECEGTERHLLSCIALYFSAIYSDHTWRDSVILFHILLEIMIDASFTPSFTTRLLLFLPLFASIMNDNSTTATRKRRRRKISPLIWKMLLLLLLLMLVQNWFHNHSTLHSNE